MAFTEASHCCGCSLKTRAIIIGGFYTMMSFVNLFLCVQYSLNYEKGQETLDELEALDIDDDDELLPGLRTISDFTIHVVGVVTVLWGPLLVLSIVLICGAVKESPRLVKPWIVWAAVTLTSNTFIAMLYITVHFYYGFNNYGTKIIVTTTVSGVIFICSIMTVNSFYQALLKQRIIQAAFDEHCTLPAKEIDKYHIVYGELEQQQDFQITTKPQKNIC